LLDRDVRRDLVALPTVRLLAGHVVTVGKASDALGRRSGGAVGRPVVLVGRPRPPGKGAKREGPAVVAEPLAVVRNLDPLAGPTAAVPGEAYVPCPLAPALGHGSTRVTLSLGQPRFPVRHVAHAHGGGVRHQPSDKWCVVTPVRKVTPWPYRTPRPRRSRGFAFEVALPQDSQGGQRGAPRAPVVTTPDRLP
jgi:hypothetical protein